MGTKKLTVAILDFGREPEQLVRIFVVNALRILLWKGRRRKSSVVSRMVIDSGFYIETRSTTTYSSIFPPTSP